VGFHSLFVDDIKTIILRSLSACYRSQISAQQTNCFILTIFFNGLGAFRKCLGATARDHNCCLSVTSAISGIIHFRVICFNTIDYFFQRFSKLIILNFLTLWRRNFFLILAHPVCKMWILQEPKKVALWNKRHFEEKRMANVQHV
jgi:hypothetical protein